MQALRQLLITLGIQVSGREQLDDVANSAQKATQAITTMASAIAGLGILKGITSFITGIVDEGAKLANMADRLGVSTNDLQAFAYAANMVGVSTDQAGNSLKFFNRHLGLAEDGNKTASKDFQKLGISILDSHGKLKPMSDLLPEVADSFAKLKDDAERTEVSIKLFSRQGAGLIPILRDGSAGLRAFYQEFADQGGGLKDDAIKKLREADRAITRLTLGFSVLRSRLVLQMEPAFQWFLVTVSKMSRAMADFADHTLIGKTALAALVSAGIYLLSPLLLAIAPIVAAATALYLVFDDIFTMFAGGNSVLGNFIDTLFGEGAHKTFVQDFQETLEHLIDWIKTDGIKAAKEFWEWWTTSKWGESGTLKFLRTLGDVAQATWTALKGIADVMALIAADAPGSGSAIDKANSKIQTIIEGGKSDATLNYEAKMRNWQKGVNATLGTDVLPEDVAVSQGESLRVSKLYSAKLGLNPDGSAKTGSGVTVQGDLNISVDTQATDAAGTADAVKKAFTSSTQNASNRGDYAAVTSTLPGGN